MKIRLYSVLDRTAKQFGAPMSFVNDETARRSFIDAFVDPDSVFAMHPEDFELHYIGDFDNETKMLVTELLPEPVLSGASAIFSAQQISRPSIDLSVQPVGN
jgi:hypothetical protein